MKAYEFLDQLVSNNAKASNARKLIEASSTALCHVITSVGRILIASLVIITVVVHYNGINAVTVGATAAAGTGLLTWATQAFWKHRKRE